MFTLFFSLYNKCSQVEILNDSTLEYLTFFIYELKKKSLNQKKKLIKFQFV